MLKDVPPAEMEAMLLADAKVDDDALRQLANRRAQAVKDAIVANSIPASAVPDRAAGRKSNRRRAGRRRRGTGRLRTRRPCAALKAHRVMTELSGPSLAWVA